jgi:hypothetical protein
MHHHERDGKPQLRAAGERSVKGVGFLLLLAGWLLVLASLILLPKPQARIPFIFAGIGVELLGLVLAARAHLRPREDAR